jgi:hypothetical protein
MTMNQGSAVWKFLTEAIVPPGRAGTAGQTGGGNQTVTGKVVDIDYYARTKDGKGKGLDQGLIAARSSVKWEGMPAGLVTADGKAYQITGGLAANNNAKISELLGQTVTITGNVYDKDGMTMISADSATAVK